MSIADQKVYKLKGKLQQYAWGGERFLPDFLGIKNEDNQSFAEYWLGAHDSAPSEIDDETKLSLNTIIKDQSAGILEHMLIKNSVDFPISSNCLM